MAKCRRPVEAKVPKHVVRPPDEVKDDCPPSETASNDISLDDTKKLSEAVGGIPAVENQSKDLKKDDESSRLWQSSDVDCPKSELEVDTKSGSRPCPKVYRSLSQNTSEDMKKLEKPNSDDDTHLSISLNSKHYDSATWNLSELGDIRLSGIRLSATASSENQAKTKSESEQNNVRIHQKTSSAADVESSGDQITHNCTDVGGADSAVSGSTEDQSYSENVPFIVQSNDQQKEYKSKYFDLRKKAKSDHKNRMMPRTESNCTSYSCYHPEKNHDWSNHSMNKKQIYNYAWSRTGHIFQREMNTFHYKECGTCCHIGDGYVLTCYHCIKKTLYRDMYSWPKEWLLHDDLTVTFPADVSTSLTGRKTRQYRFEPHLYDYDEDLDFALLRLDQRNSEQIPEHFSRYTNVNGDEEHLVYIAGYQIHPKHTYGKLVVDASALKFPRQALNIQFVQVWSKKQKERFQDSIENLHKGICPWNYTYYPIERCGDYFPVLSSLITGASGGFGLTCSAQDDQHPVVNFMFRAGYPKFYYNSHFDNSGFPVVQQYIRDNFPPCWTFQEGVPIGPIVEKIKKSPDTSLNAIPFLMSNF